jgi:predicted GTPase
MTPDYVMPKKIIICGAAGRDFHNFNVLFRDNPAVEVTAFTASQIPNIDGRRYPPELAGTRYPDGIPVIPESEMAAAIRKDTVDEVLFSYSDVSFGHVMHLASISLSAGASFRLASPESTMLRSKKPVVSVCAVRTGCGKSQTTRAVVDVLSAMGLDVVTVRHPMPYGDIGRQAVQRFARKSDFEKHHCTIEEMEEYEPHIERGCVIYAGVDYARILAAAEEEADIIVWDGGNNDTPFFRSDLEIVVVDPHRPGHELLYHPGETNFLRADVIVINKLDSAAPESVARLEANISRYNPSAAVIRAESAIACDEPERIRAKRVVAVEDGPTLTHGGMAFGAGVVAAERFGAKEIMDPRPWAKGEVAEIYRSYPEIGRVLPAVGYGPGQIRDLEATLSLIPCDAVVVATPVDLSRIISIDKPIVRIRYELAVRGKPDLADVLRDIADRGGSG